MDEKYWLDNSVFREVVGGVSCLKNGIFVSNVVSILACVSFECTYIGGLTE